MRKTKIICTLGPATEDEKVLRELMLAGMDICRFNFSHGDHETHKQKYDTVVKIREQLGLPVATMLDTKGPEIRICKFKDTKVMLQKGDTFKITTREEEGTKDILSVTNKN